MASIAVVSHPAPGCELFNVNLPWVLFLKSSDLGVADAAEVELLYRLTSTWATDAE